MMRKSYEMVMNIPAPYRLPLFKEMARQLKARGYDFHVHFMARGHAERPQSWFNPIIDVPHTFYRDWGVGQFHFNPGLIWHVLLHPSEWLELGNSYDTVTCIVLAFLNRAKRVVIGLEGNTKTPGRMDGFVGWFKRLILARATNFHTPSSDGIKFFDLHRMRTKKQLAPCAILPNVIDESRFHTRDEFIRMGKASEIAGIRQERFLSKESDRVCLIPARLEPVKGIVPFIERLTPEMLVGWRIVLLGQGSLKNEVIRLIDTRGLTPFFTQLDYVNYDDMPLYYAAADLILLPSVYDPNPLTSVETVHSGLPLALSCMAGNVEEAVTDGVNGWVLPVMDKLAFEKTLKIIFSTPIDRLQEMGRVSKSENSRYWILAKAVESFFDTMGVV